jgi:hypothetical protein
MFVMLLISLIGSSSDAARQRQTVTKGRNCRKSPTVSSMFTI